MIRREIPESWASIPGYTFYEASTHGRIRNKKTGRILKPYDKKKAGEIVDPRLKVDIRRDEQASRKQGGSRLHPYVSRLVCLAYYGEPPFPEAQAEHEDGCKTNDKLSNLSWQSASANEQRKVFQGKRKFTPEDIRFIRRSPMSVTDLSFYYGCSVRAIYAIRRGDSYRQVTSDMITDSLPHVKTNKRRGMTDQPQDPTR